MEYQESWLEKSAPRSQGKSNFKVSELKRIKAIIFTQDQSQFIAPWFNQEQSQFKPKSKASLNKSKASLTKIEASLTKILASCTEVKASLTIIKPRSKIF